MEEQTEDFEYNVPLHALTKEDRELIKKHKELYERLLVCTDLDLFKDLSKEYADLDYKVERILNRDKAGIMRSAYESQFSIIK